MPIQGVYHIVLLFYPDVGLILEELYSFGLEDVTASVDAQLNGIVFYGLRIVVECAEQAY